MSNLSLHRISSDRICKPVAALLTFTLCLAASSHSAFGQAADPPPPTEPVHKVIPVHLDPTTGNIQVGRTTYPGRNPGLHILALKRQPPSGLNQQDSPDLIGDQVLTDKLSANNFLTQMFTTSKDALVIVNGVGNFGFAISDIADNLIANFGGQIDLRQAKSMPAAFIFIGNGGLNKGGAFQRGGNPNLPSGTANPTFPLMDIWRSIPTATTNSSKQIMFATTSILITEQSRLEAPPTQHRTRSGMALAMETPFVWLSWIAKPFRSSPTIAIARM